MRVAFDGTPLHPPLTGVGHYTENLLRHLANRPQDAELILISNRAPRPARPLDALPRRAEGSDFRYRSVWLQIQAPRLLDRIKPDLVHFTNSTIPLKKRFPTVVTIHDMSLRLFPRFHPARRRLTRPLVDWSARNADLVIAVSRSAARDISRLTGRPESRIRVVYSAAAPEFRPAAPGRAAEIRAKYDLEVPFVLFVGTLEPRKNLPALIEAFSRLKRRGGIPHQLVLAGQPGWGRRPIRRRIRQADARGHVRQLGYVPLSDLPALYTASDAFVFPSVHEGFGLPILEAMACGTPVVASDVSSMAEISAGAVEGVDPLDVTSIENGLRRVLESPDRRAELSELGLVRCREFSWERAAAETLEAYRSALGR